MLLLVLYAIRMFVCLNSFVMNVVSLPVYVNVHQLLSVWVCCICELSVLDCVWVCVGVCSWVLCLFLGAWVWMWYALLCRMFCMVFTCCWNSLSCRSYVFSRLCKNLIAAYLCCGGWLELYGNVVSV